MSNNNEMMTLVDKINQRYITMYDHVKNKEEWRNNSFLNLILANEISDIAEKLSQLSDRVKLELHKGRNLTLGQLIEYLENSDPEAVVVFDDGKHPDVYIQSYRGDYRHAAVDKCDVSITASEWVRCLKNSIGETRLGYKGGEFTMFLETPVWQSEYGMSSQMAIVGVAAGFGPNALLVIEHIPD